MEKMMKEIEKLGRKQERGITLVALVITIVVIIILATVTINFTFREGGIINQAESARDYYANDTKYTEDSLANVTAYLNEVLSGTVRSTAPTTPTVAFSSKTNTALTVTARSTDAEGDNLSYTLYAGTTSGNLDKVSSAVEVAQNQTATITLSGLSPYTYYYWRVDVSDGTATTRGQEQSSVRTYCYTTRCTSGYTTANGRTCTSCSGTGTRTSTCTACGGSGKINSGVTCTTCNGKGTVICRCST